ncbi:HD domain-containing protein [Bizionia myxarmorum]|uniref:Metal-dependent phosphohydrolase n=1 Tax=Bizionia myxarmorum TaxID=291186 RepID=A0A5D0R1A1_9FLAO|nr:HD domain-containing protein [Bizionia myxarmorum]TYB74274.1 metal-dependent phosphohydrolase [Bizionia myxarmorum]
MTIKSITRYCSDILHNNKCKNLPLHNFVHNQEVIDNVFLISNAIRIWPKEIDYIVIAACFHDTGFSKTYKNYEATSKRIAAQYLAKAKYNNEEIDKVCSYIEATKMPQDPQDIYAKVLCNAILFHLGTTDFWYKNLLLRKEWELFDGIVMVDSEWQMLNIKFLEAHRFKTDYGKEVLEKGKQENLNKLKQLIRIR